MKPSDKNNPHEEIPHPPADQEPKVIIEKERCKGCALCVIYCPRKRIKMSQELNNYGSLYAVFSDVKDNEDDNDSQSSCNSCGFCYIVCPEVAIEVRKK